MSRGEPEARVLVVDDKLTGLTLGADDYVTKPFSVEEVRRKVDTTEPKLIHTLRSVGYVLREPQPSRA